MPVRQITPADLWPIERYAAERKRIRADIVEKKKVRRCEVGPFCTFYFESYDTMWAQVMEMLFIEKGGEGQVADELAAYNPLVPNGRELTATVMFEIDDEARRRTVLGQLGGIERTAFLEIGGQAARGVPEEDTERTDATGKASSVHFLHFPLGPEVAAAFKTPGARVVAGFDHPRYSHMTVVPEATRAALAADLD